VLLLEGGPRLLPTYPSSLSDKAKQKLRRLGVEVRTETFVTDIRPGSVAAAFNHQKGGTLPGICPVAIQMGEYAAGVIRGEVAGRPRLRFKYWDKGQLAVIGRGQAVADIWKLRFGGFFAWLT